MKNNRINMSFQKIIKFFNSRPLWEKVVAGLIVAFILWFTRHLWLGLIGKSEPSSVPNSVVSQPGPNSTSQTAIGKDINQVLKIDNSRNQSGGIHIERVESGATVTINVIDYQDDVSKATKSEVRELFQKARAHYARKEFQEAIEDFTHCLDIEEDSEKRGALNLQIGNCYFEQYLYLKAAESYALGLRESREANDLAGVASNIFGRANTYMLRPSLDIKMRGDNVRKAIEDYNSILSVFNKDEYPFAYALTQNNLGNAYRYLPTTTSNVRTENVYVSINCYHEALSIYTKEEYPFEYAMVKNNLGLAYIDLPASNSEKRIQNIKTAIEYYQEANEIRKKDEYPVEYADTQTNIGSAYILLWTMNPEQIENLNKSLKSFQEATEIRKKEIYPIGYALTQNNLGNVYIYLPWLNTDELINNIDKAIKCFQNALEIFKKDKYPVYYAMTKNNLGLAYMHLAATIPKNRSQNIQTVIECYREALEIRRKDEYPQDYCETAANLGLALVLINDPNACYWLNEAFALREYLNNQGKDIDDIIRQNCKKSPE